MNDTPQRATDFPTDEQISAALRERPPGALTRAEGRVLEACRTTGEVEIALSRLLEMLGMGEPPAHAEETSSPSGCNRIDSVTEPLEVVAKQLTGVARRLEQLVEELA